MPAVSLTERRAAAHFALVLMPLYSSRIQTFIKDFKTKFYLNPITLKRWRNEKKKTDVFLTGLQQLDRAGRGFK